MTGSRSDETLLPVRAWAKFSRARTIEQFQLALDCIGRILGLDRTRIGNVHENQLAVGVARPDRAQAAN